jgi:FAD/FMN-containing dehydrogenase/Fe-S oxidoreductase
MHAPTAHGNGGDLARLAARLRNETSGEVLFDAASRGRYATDASIYQIEPVGVVVPRSEADAMAALAIAAEAGIPVLPRGAGSSQCGQAVGAALVIDHTKYLRNIVAIDAAKGEAVVEPGLVLDQLNAALKPHGLWFPVDVSTSAQATLGGMAGNNSCGARSIRHGNMVHNVLGIEATLAGGGRYWFESSAGIAAAPAAYRELAAKLSAIVAREAGEIALRWPKVLRRVQGYNIDMLVPAGDGAPVNLAHLLVGSEGTLALTNRLRLKLAKLPAAKVLGVCHFPSFQQAMALTRDIVALDPDAVELVDRTMLDLALANPAFRATLESVLIGAPEVVLLVEFAGDDKAALIARLKRLSELMADLGLPDSVSEVVDGALQREIWEIRKAGLNIMMSMKGEGKPVSFIEDCAVPLEHLADYTARLTAVFAKHGTRGTWYAHASVGTLHVRPILDMKRDGHVKMRAIAEEACALVREYKGAYSGEHGDGLVRSEWIEPIIGSRLTRALGEIKALFDPGNLMNPGKIVAPTKQDDRGLFRFKPGYATPEISTALDWSEWLDNEAPGIAGARADRNGFAAAVEMCNNNGHCRKFDAGTMCPSFRATRDERHLTRGRANTLRLALSGQLGAGALAADEVRDALDLCVGCKGCKRECPTGIDMARMKIETTHAYKAKHGFTLRDRLIGHLPRYAPAAARFAGLLNLRNRSRALRRLGEWATGLAAQRELPRWSAKPFLRSLGARAEPAAPDLALFADTFNNYFEPENLGAALGVLEAAGYAVHVAGLGRRPLCCGRTYLSAGMVERAKTEAARVAAALLPSARRGMPIVGLEPSCLYTLRDEYRALLPRNDAAALGGAALLFEEFLARERKAGRLKLALKALPQAKAKLHGHCHQKAFGAMGSVSEALALVPGLAVEPIETSCCGMAGAFGYEREHHAVSVAMGELALLPAVRAAGAGTLIVADGTSCRHQIRDGAGREALHVARVLAAALA